MSIAIMHAYESNSRTAPSIHRAELINIDIEDVMIAGLIAAEIAADLMIVR